MGKRGPRPKPTNLKVIEGTYRADRAPANEARPVGDASPPEWLTDDQLEAWDRIVPHLAAVGLATDVDSVLLSRYVQLLMAWIDLAEDIRGLDAGRRYHLTNAGALRPHPAYGEFRALSAELLKLEREFGMSPSARTRVEAAPTEVEEDEWTKRARRSR